MLNFYLHIIFLPLLLTATAALSPEIFAQSFANKFKCCCTSVAEVDVPGSLPPCAALPALHELSVKSSAPTKSFAAASVPRAPVDTFAADPSSSTRTSLHKFIKYVRLELIDKTDCEVFSHSAVNIEIEEIDTFTSFMQKILLSLKLRTPKFSKDELEIFTVISFPNFMRLDQDTFDFSKFRSQSNGRAYVNLKNLNDIRIYDEEVLQELKYDLVAIKNIDVSIPDHPGIIMMGLGSYSYSGNIDQQFPEFLQKKVNRDKKPIHILLIDPGFNYSIDSSCEHKQIYHQSPHWQLLKEPRWIAKYKVRTYINTIDYGARVTITVYATRVMPREIEPDPADARNPTLAGDVHLKELQATLFAKGITDFYVGNYYATSGVTDDDTGETAPEKLYPGQILPIFARPLFREEY